MFFVGPGYTLTISKPEFLACTRIGCKTETGNPGWWIRVWVWRFPKGQRGLEAAKSDLQPHSQVSGSQRVTEIWNQWHGEEKDPHQSILSAEILKCQGNWGNAKVSQKSRNQNHISLLTSSIGLEESRTRLSTFWVRMVSKASITRRMPQKQATDPVSWWPTMGKSTINFQDKGKKKSQYDS